MRQLRHGLQPDRPHVFHAEANKWLASVSQTCVALAVVEIGGEMQSLAWMAL